MEKSKKIEVIYFCLMAMLSGIMIGIGGTASLLANNLLPTYGKLVGACLFTLGMYTIVSYEMNLFTGMISKIPTMERKNYWKLPVCFMSNLIGIALVAFFVSFTMIGDAVSAQAFLIADAKLNIDSFWALHALCSSILCGILITLSVYSAHYAPRKGLSATLGVIFPIIVFAFCGFDHSVANLLYFFFYGSCTWKMIGFILISIAGNILGGVLMPLVFLLKEKTHS